MSSTDDDGICRHRTVRRVTRPELEALCRALGLVAIGVHEEVRR